MKPPESFPAFTDPAQKQLLQAMDRNLPRSMRRLESRAGVSVVDAGPALRWLEDHGLAHQTPGHRFVRSIGYAATMSIPFDIERFPFELQAKTSGGWVSVSAKGRLWRHALNGEELRARVADLEASGTVSARKWTVPELAADSIPEERPITAIRGLRRTPGGSPIPFQEWRQKWTATPAEQTAL